MKRILLAILFAALIVLAIPRIVRPIVVSHAHPLVSGQQSPQEQQLRTFAGTIVSKEGGMFFLQEDTSKAMYALDDQALASKFVEKKVLVTGALDKTGIIHVKTIEEQKA